MPDIVLAPCNHSHCYVWADAGPERELSDEFSYVVPGSEYMKRGFRKNWDGKVRLLNRTTKLIYMGLVPRIIEWATKRGYELENKLPQTTSNWTDMDTQRLIETHPVPHEIRDYQREAITWGMHRQRCVLLSPTASGKSLVLYYLVRARLSVGPVLLIVPTISLVSQMAEDWRAYGWADVDRYVHRITGGVTKDTTKPVVVSTWQSIFKLGPEWFAQFQSVLGDECHGYKADSLRGIMENLPHCGFRIGVTGTLDDSKSHKLVVEGVFGKSKRVARTADLQIQGHLTPIRVQAHFLQYNKYDRWMIQEHKRKYVEEVDYIVQHPGRMEWLVDFLGMLPGNVLVLFQFVEKHGLPLLEALKKKYGTSRPIHFVSGMVSGEDREDIRALIETQSNAIIVASYGVFSTGVNVKKLHCVVLASPSKSKYRVLQSIGRGLRLHSSKKEVFVMDIVDDAHDIKYHNYAFRHWKVRTKFYREESFPVELYTHDLPNNENQL